MPASHDAARLATLVPGAYYTAQVSGAQGTSGVALVEVYEAPWGPARERGDGERARALIDLAEKGDLAAKRRRRRKKTEWREKC